MPPKLLAPRKRRPKGSVPPKAPKPAPLPKSLAIADEDDLIGAPAGPEDEGDDEGVSIDLAETYAGVSANWLAQMFGADKNTIKKKLAASGIEIIGRRNSGPLYRLADAAPYLVKPKVDLVSFIKGLRPNDLPPMLNEAYWSAMIKRQKWEENAKELWHTDKVLAVLGELNVLIRTRVTLWTEDVDRREGLTQAQRQIIIDLSDDLLKSVHQLLVDMPTLGSTAPSVAEDGAIPGTSELEEEVIE